MAQFLVPKYIEREARILGGMMTFKQFFILVFGGLTIIVFWFLFGHKNMLLFLFLSFLAGLITFSFAFGKIQGKSIPSVILGSISFFFQPKVFLWRKKELISKIIEMRPKEKEKKEEPTLRVIEQSKLHELRIKKGVF